MTQIGWAFVAATVAIFAMTVPLSADDTLDQSIARYQQRYAIGTDKTNPYEKIVHDRGQGPDTLRGLRNLRAVLPGLVYRSGANNSYRNLYGKTKLDNQNPLPPEGRDNLCQEGFATAIYLYPTNYNSDTASNACHLRSDVSPQQPIHTLAYLNKLPLTQSNAIREILQIVHTKLTGSADHGPMLVHCWNGWHASGLTSTLILRQFCGVGADDAVAYWNCNTDGVCIGKSYGKIRNRIRAFTPYDDLKIDENIKDKVCPKLANACPHPPKKACPT